MPELPEVETIVRNLREGKDGPPLVGRRIVGAEVLWARSVAKPDASDFLRLVARQTVQLIHRRAKFIVITLNRHTLLAHLRMSGDLRLEREAIEGESQKVSPHDRVVLHLEEGWRLVFNDARKFGRLWLVEDSQSVLETLGPEPLEPALTEAGFLERLRERRRQLKPLLLDQSFLAGLGNIYTDEALHLAQLHPGRFSHQLNPEEASRLLSAIRAVLQEGIRRNGASIDWVYRGGEFQNSFRVYRRTGLPCPVCGSTIDRSVVGQRGTHTCPVCQPRP
jgi:formamidopyrimidine-DNA glycosylase